ncbi:hypothetical protein K501DRAFT_269896 [Backusella circina FSU 941]|nr:hypothetical protein K501DRAFT_269896 [Backusella circina FSU 941]
MNINSLFFKNSPLEETSATPVCSLSHSFCACCGVDVSVFRTIQCNPKKIDKSKEKVTEKGSAKNPKKKLIVRIRDKGVRVDYLIKHGHGYSGSGMMILTKGTVRDVGDSSECVLDEANQRGIIQTIAVLCDGLPLRYMLKIKEQANGNKIYHYGIPTLDTLHEALASFYTSNMIQGRVAVTCILTRNIQELNNEIENSGELTSMSIPICCHYSMLTTPCSTTNSIFTECFPLEKFNSENIKDHEFVLKNPIPYLMFSSAVLMKVELILIFLVSEYDVNYGTLQSITKKALVILIDEYTTSITCSNPLDNVYRSEDFKCEHKQAESYWY